MAVTSSRLQGSKIVFLILSLNDVVGICANIEYAVSLYTDIKEVLGAGGLGAGE